MHDLLLRLGVGWRYLRQYLAAVVAAWLLFLGIIQLLGLVCLSVGIGVVWLVNFVIRHGFRDQMPIESLAWLPWRYQVFSEATGLIALVLGIFVGLWILTRNGRPEAAS
jgi:hypothetical protein